MSRRLAVIQILSLIFPVLMLHAIDAQTTPGQSAVIVSPPGCNATAFVQVPGSTDLFIGRQLLTADGQTSGISGPNDCSGGNPDNRKTGKIFNRWSLVLDRLDWKTHTFSIVKPLLDTSIDPKTRHSRALITDGPMRGALVRSAYDASIVVYRNQYIVAYECNLEEDKRFSDGSTSACISIYDPPTQTLDLSRTQVMISGTHASKVRFSDAAVPELLVFKDRLFLYWSATPQKNVGIEIRGTELEVVDGGIAVKGSHTQMVHAIDEPLTTAVWSPDPDDPTANTTVDLLALWMSGNKIIAASSPGGAGCTVPDSSLKGCFHLAIVRADKPLGKDVFGRAQKVEDAELPSNTQEYTHPIRDPNGNYWFIGHYIKPLGTGASEPRPVPGEDFWQKTKQTSVLVMFPIADKSLWPTE